MQISLHKNGWHRKLQLFTSKTIPQYDNFCPYFWITIFCILALPFTSIFRSLGWIVGLAFFLIGNLLPSLELIRFYPEDRLGDWRTRRMIINLPDSLIYSLKLAIERNHSYHLGFRTADRLLALWQLSTEDYRERLIDIVTRFETANYIHMLTRGRRNEERRERRNDSEVREHWLKVVKLTQKFCSHVGTVSLFSFCFGAVVFAGYLAASVLDTVPLSILILSGFVILSMVGLTVGVTHLLIKYEDCVLQFLDNWGKRIGKKYKRLKSLFAPVAFIYYYVKVSVSDSCPPIEWED